MPDGSIVSNLIVSGSGNVINIGAADFPHSTQARHYLRMLAVIAAPVANAQGDGPPDGPPLDVWGEWERLRSAVEDRDPITRAAAAWAVVRLQEPTADGLRDALRVSDAPYQVIHFSCHGNSEGVVLEDRLGRERFLRTAQLVDILSAAPPQMLVLNACETLDVARGLLEGTGVRTVIATCKSIYDIEAKLLAQRLYRCLAAGQTAGEGLTEFRRELLAQLAARDLPRLGKPTERAANVQLIGDGALRLAAEEPAATAPYVILHATPHNDPLPMHSVAGFVGRWKELLALARWFGQTGQRAFAISGVGGIGKTALALNAALRHAHQFDALAFASAKDEPDFGPRQVLDALNAALGIGTSPDGTANLPGEITRRLNERSVLLVLDNLETLSDASTRELGRALSGIEQGSRSRVLVTLRPRDKDPLTTLAGANHLRLTGLDDASALRLALEEAQRQGLDFAQLAIPPQPLVDSTQVSASKQQAWLDWLDTEVAVALLDLAALAFRHPAFLLMAVAMVREHGWVGTRARLVRLKGQQVEEALEAFIGQMVDDLASRWPAALEALYAVLPFRGGAQSSLLRYVLLGEEVAADSDAAIDADDALRPAVMANLLACTNDRYDLDPPVRAYLERRRPADPGIIATYELRHAEAFLPIVAAYDGLLGQGLMTYSAPLEWPNVSASFDRMAARAPHDREAARVLLAHAMHWRNVIYNNHDPRRATWLSAAVSAAGQVGSSAEQANVLKAQGDVLAFQKQNTEALARYEAALGLFRAVGDRLGEANVLQAQGDVLAFQDQRDEALARYEAALGLFRAVGARLGEANVLKAQGDVLRRQDNYAEAISCYEGALALYRLTGSRQGEANAFLGLGRLALAQEDFVRAREWSEQAIALHSANQSRYDVALDCEVLAQACRAAGDHEAAIAALRRSSSNYQQIGLLDRFVSVLTTLGDVLDAAGRKEEALAVYAALVERQPDQAWLRRNYANSLINLARLDDAEVQLDAAEQLEPDAPYLALRRAELAKARGNRAETIRWAEEALRRSPDWDEAQKLLDEANA